MTIVRRLVSEITDTRAASLTTLQDLIVAAGRSPRSTAGRTVTDDSARRVMAVWRCQHLLADVISGLPVQQYRRVPGARAEEIGRSPWVESPSQFVDGSTEWRYQLVLSAAARGNAYAYVTELDSTMRFAARAEVLNPHDVTVERELGALAPPVYKIRNQVVDPTRLLHFRAFGPAPGSVMGLSPIDHAAWAIGFAMASRDYAGRWFEGGGHPTAKFSADRTLEPGEIDAVKERYRQAIENDGVLVTGKSWDYEALQVSPEQAAFLDAMSATAIDIAGYFGLPPELLGYATEGSSVTYANREQRMIDVLVLTVQWWIGRLERFISAQLPADQFVRINIDALLRSDTLTRYKAHDLAIRSGMATPNERRELEDQAPLPDAGDEALWPPFSTNPQPAE